MLIEVNRNEQVVWLRDCALLGIVDFRLLCVVSFGSLCMISYFFCLRSMKRWTNDMLRNPTDVSKILPFDVEVWLVHVYARSKGFAAMVDTCRTIVRFACRVVGPTLSLSLWLVVQ